MRQNSCKCMSYNGTTAKQHIRIIWKCITTVAEEAGELQELRLLYCRNHKTLPFIVKKNQSNHL